MKKADIQAHYAAEIKAATDRQLFAIVRKEIDAPYRVREALYESAIDELIGRGYEMPIFSALFTF